VILKSREKVLTHNKKVIPLIRPLASSKWRYWDFVYANGTNPIEDWYQALPEDVQDLFDALLKNNQKTERPQQWTGFRRFLRGGDLKKYGVWELELKGEDGLARRMMGVFDGPKTAIFLIGCYHKGGNYTPSNALDTAEKRAALYFQKKANKRERTVKEDL
jgi:phage-related protein